MTWSNCTYLLVGFKVNQTELSSSDWSGTRRQTMDSGLYLKWSMIMLFKTHLISMNNLFLQKSRREPKQNETARPAAGVKDTKDPQQSDKPFKHHLSLSGSIRQTAGGAKGRDDFYGFKLKRIERKTMIGWFSAKARLTNWPWASTWRRGLTSQCLKLAFLEGQNAERTDVNCY